MTTVPLINRSPFLSETEESGCPAAYSKAFTLIELLTVIVIVLILMALLLPALSRAKYEAKNVVCINNQKQIAAGVSTYATDYDRHYPGYSGHSAIQETTKSDGTPVKKIWFYRSAPTLLVSKNRGLDYPGMMRPYFGGTLKNSFVCSLAPDLYKQKGAVDAGKPRDIDTQAGITTYSHYYGRMGKYRYGRLLDRLKGSIASSGWTGLVETPASDSFWGSGEVYFTPSLKRGMMKIGDTQKIDIKNPIVDEAEYSLLTTDVAWAWNNMYRWTHEAYGQKTTRLSYGPAERYKEFFWDTGSEALGTHLAMNYSTADGSVHSIKNIRHLDSRVAATRYGGNNGKLWAYRAWLLPQPE